MLEFVNGERASGILFCISYSKYVLLQGFVLHTYSLAFLILEHTVQHTLCSEQ